MKREENHNDFKKKSEKLQEISLRSQMALEYFNNEFKIPFRSANAFRSMLENHVFGHVNPIYIDYFNDLCSQDIELYYMINKVMELYKAKGDIYDNGDESFCLNAITFSMLKKHANNLNLNNITTIINAEDFLSQPALKKTIELFLDNIFSIFMSCANGNEKYKTFITLKNNETGNTLLIARMQHAETAVAHHNDNDKIIELSSLINSIKNFEDIFAGDTHKPLINLDNMLVRGKINIMDFLASIYNSYVKISIKSNEATFTITLNQNADMPSKFLENTLV